MGNSIRYIIICEMHYIYIDEQIGAIMLSHELNNFTMAKAVQFYPQLKATFKVDNLFLITPPLYE